jgi:hypothetical protein
MKEKFREFLNNNFGEHITDALLESENLKLRKGNAKELYECSLDQNKEQVLKLVNENQSEAIIKNRWAFDFPGWIGTLDIKKENVKDILVIGMEPHIGEIDNEGVNRTAQVTYGLRETGNLEYKELAEYFPNKMLWNNLNSIFGKNDQYDDRDFLERIYITDMCHFAVKGKVTETYEIKNWSKIREQNAEKYILETINFIKPKYIVSQSNPVADFVDRYLLQQGTLINEWNPQMFSDELKGSYRNFPNFKNIEFNKKKIIHIRLPHLASGNTNRFWLPKQPEKRNPKMKEIREKLKEFEKQNN